MSYHIHPVTGTPALCRAEKGHCPFGARQEHFESKEDARGAFEAQMKEELLPAQPYDPITAAGVRELFDYHISRAEDPDVKMLLDRTKEDLATATSVVKLNRISALYLSAANDLDDEENLAEASDMVGVIADQLRDYYRRRRTYMGFDGDEEKLEIRDAREFIMEILEDERVRDLNQSLIQGEDNGLVNTKGYKVALVRNEENVEESLGEFIRNVSSDDSYYGKASIAKNTEAKRFVEAKAQELVDTFSIDGVFHAPAKHDRAADKLPKGFRFLSGGEESNVYVHYESETVYKIPHAESVTRDKSFEMDEDYERNSLNAVIFNAAAYQRIDREKLATEFEAEYLNTYFLSLEDQHKKPVGVIVQPYLDDDRYMYYSLTSEERFDSRDAGVNDVHSGNVRLDRKTGKLVLFDCLFNLQA
jgi:hypothetical protein